ncbi:hypothetical protein ABN763_02630 [Spongiivirga sp. MCCC 1A20706]|uniref:hypothetical protein n=1 Tax=Spongiivirga sp. MCCC 1A20706 TaxID=3160963 RepID=UPI0039772C16
MSETVKFHRSPNLTHKRAREEAYYRGWTLATSSDLEQALNNLNFEPFVIGWVKEGKLAVPLKTKSSTLDQGINLGAIEWEMEARNSYKEVYPSKGINEGFFYVEGRPLDENDKPNPDDYVTEEYVGGGKKVYTPEEWLEESRRRDILAGPFPGQARTWNYDKFNVFFDGWETEERALLESAAKALLKKEEKPYGERDIKLLSLEIKVDPVRRFQYAPFLLEELYTALAATQPTASQAAYQRRFNYFTSSKKWLYANKLLEDWKTHTNAPDAKISKLTDGSYKPPTLSVWKEVMHNRPSKKGFVAMDITHMYFTPKGSELVAKLFAPTYVKEFSMFEDKINLKSAGGNLQEILKGTLGVSAFSLMMLGTIPFIKFRIREIARNKQIANEAVAFGEDAEIARLQRELAQATQDLVSRANDMTFEPLPNVVPSVDRTVEATNRLNEIIGEINGQAAEAVSRVATNQTARNGAIEFLEESYHLYNQAKAKLVEAIGEALAETFPRTNAFRLNVLKVLSKYGLDFIKLSEAISVVGILITAGQVLGEELSDLISGLEYGKALREASEWKNDNVSKYLNPDKVISNKVMDARKVAVLHELIHFSISIPGERGIISFEYPELATEFGKKKGFHGQQYWDVKFFKVYDQPFEHVKKMAASRNMRLATEAEVYEALFYLNLNGPRGYISNGQFVLPLTMMFADRGRSIPAGVNKGITGTNDGFYYVDIKPELGVNYSPIAALPNDRKPDYENVTIKNVAYNSCLQNTGPNSIGLNVLLNNIATWKVLYKSEYISQGKIRIQHLSSGQYLMALYDSDNVQPNVGLGRPVNDPTFMLMGNYGFWILEEIPNDERHVYIKTEAGLYLDYHDMQKGLQLVSKDPNSTSQRWELMVYG